ncbi:DUF1330 domain-containing protein [Solimonas fluminis]|jgi:uncharacterized protein (DUF1330 family)|uniref:DUF1330 domain-containing protein n=1 Tax=Solimonas fluminis TaxID=2086571 RepID=A0A2S5TFW3_9GAMM|nr:DUF1330 domain-containing protein [Solimonas fluminis]PPE73807.1 DUF1330 domain-containing protein [Solimonas fluminis]
MTRTIDPSGADIKRIATGIPMDTPVTMLNLLRFREQAAYPQGSGHAPCSGREAYGRYSLLAEKRVRAVGGQPVFLAEAIGRFIGPEDERWDEVLLVRYPSMQAFLQMVANPDYRAETVHRSAALEDSRLVVMRTPKDEVGI